MAWGFVMQLVLICGGRDTWGQQQVCAHTLTHNHAYIMMPHKVNYELNSTVYTSMHSLANVSVHTCVVFRFNHY